MDDSEQLERYSRQILLPEIDLEGQARFGQATVMLLGAGGLGSPAALYLVGAGIGHLILCDQDAVDLSNLHRQILHSTADIGRPKTDSGRDRLVALNPGVRVTGVAKHLDGEALRRQVRRADVVLDGSDNFATRYAVSEACIAERRPLIMGAAIRFAGHVVLFDHRQGTGPCLACLYPRDGEEPESCAAMGVFGPLTGVIGSLMAAAALKFLLGAADALTGRLLRLDAWRLTLAESRVVADPACPACGPDSGPGPAV